MLAMRKNSAGQEERETSLNIIAVIIMRFLTVVFFSEGGLRVRRRHHRPPRGSKVSFHENRLMSFACTTIRHSF